MDVIKQAVVDYFNLGWAATPLGLDSNGFPKRPIAQDWPRIPRTWDAIDALPWAQARGVGIVLGPVSNNLAAIDVDDVEMGETIYRLFLSRQRLTRIVRTIRKRLHVYIYETNPSTSKAFTVPWRERNVQIELKAQGTQVAAPPTPGYELLMDAPPMLCPNLLAAWTSLALHLNIKRPDYATGAGLPTGNYPRPWNPQVPSGQRNKAAYVEAHKLREARIPLDEALAIMRVRVEHAYSPGEMTWGEMEQTIRSAYSKGIPPERTERWFGGVQYR